MHACMHGLLSVCCRSFLNQSVRVFRSPLSMRGLVVCMQSDASPRLRCAAEMRLADGSLSSRCCVCVCVCVRERERERERVSERVCVKRNSHAESKAMRARQRLGGHRMGSSSVLALPLRDLTPENLNPQPATLNPGASSSGDSTACSTSCVRMAPSRGPLQRRDRSAGAPL